MAIKEIGASQISNIAVSITSAVEQQGAVVDEIARNVQSVEADNIVQVNRGAPNRLAVRAGARLGKSALQREHKARRRTRRLYTEHPRASDTRCHSGVCPQAQARKCGANYSRPNWRFNSTFARWSRSRCVFGKFFPARLM